MPMPIAPTAHTASGLTADVTADVAVIGAGVVGLATAYALARRGLQVALLERASGPALGTSFANGAQLSYAYTDAFASPSTVAQLPRLLMGLDRKTAAEFSFFLAVPTMAAATVYSLYKERDLLSFDDLGLIAIGFVTAFISALMVVRWLVGFVGRHGFAPFAWYRIVLGGVSLIWLLNR